MERNNSVYGSGYDTDDYYDNSINEYIENLRDGLGYQVDQLTQQVNQLTQQINQLSQHINQLTQLKNKLSEGKSDIGAMTEAGVAEVGKGLKVKPAEQPKKCSYRFVKGWQANTQCHTKIKGEGDFCSKHKPKKTKA